MQSNFFQLRGRHFLTLKDFTEGEIKHLLTLSESLKWAKRTGTEQETLKKKNIALIFEKTSTRTRCSFEVACFDQGANVTYLSSQGSQIGHKESIADTARVLGRLYDAIEYRGASHAAVEELAKHAGVPVYNGLTDDYHPTQFLADALTMKEHESRKRLSQMKLCFLGDTKNNVANSLMIGCAKLGIEFWLCGPKQYAPDEKLWNEVKKYPRANMHFSADVKAAVSGADYLYTDVWVSMGEPEELWKTRIKDLLPYQVNKEAMKLTNNPRAKFLHCLPAYHDVNTKIGQEIKAKYGLPSLEVTDDVFESSASLVFDQAENRLHTIKAILVATLG